MVNTDAGGRLRHGSVTVARRIAAPPERVFEAFADPALRRRWFRLPGEPGPVPHELDLRPGGHERATATFDVPGRREEVAYDAHVLDVVPGRRLVFAYVVSLDGRARTAALVSVDLAAGAAPGGPDGGHTDVTYTEQHTLIDVTGDGDRDAAHQEGGLRLLLNGLAAAAEGR
jgi:uncharacterized protein YndB with AHSA1/START domain